MTEENPVEETKLKGMSCPECKKNITHVINNIPKKPKKRIIYRPTRNPDGSRNWWNLFYVNPLTIVVVIAIVLLLLGVRQINNQCYEILEDPCDVIDRYQCKGFVEPNPITADLGWSLKVDADKGS